MWLGITRGTEPKQLLRQLTRAELAHKIVFGSLMLWRSMLSAMLLCTVCLLQPKW